VRLAAEGIAVSLLHAIEARGVAAAFV